MLRKKVHQVREQLGRPVVRVAWGREEPPSHQEKGGGKDPVAFSLSERRATGGSGGTTCCLPFAQGDCNRPGQGSHALGVQGSLAP